MLSKVLSSKRTRQHSGWHPIFCHAVDSLSDMWTGKWSDDIILLSYRNWFLKWSERRMASPAWEATRLIHRLLCTFISAVAPDFSQCCEKFRKVCSRLWVDCHRKKTAQIRAACACDVKLIKTSSILPLFLVRQTTFFVKAPSPSV